MFRFLMAAYGAAGISFGSSLLRDYAVVNFSHQDKEFFQSLYVVSMAAGFGVNAIALGGRALGWGALTVLFVFGVIIIFVLSPPAGINYYREAMLVLILLMWLAGAQWSRRLMESGWVFAARIREAISSVVLAGLIIFLGQSVNDAFLAAVLVGTIFSWSMWQATKPEAMCNPGTNYVFVGIKKLFLSVLLTNVATFSITYWAFVQTGKFGELYGFDISAVIRFSMYFYQILTIGSVILVARGFYRRMAHWPVSWLLVSSIFLFLASLFIPLQMAIFMVPLFAAVMHYGMVMFLQKISVNTLI
jgi:hypothetical protein